MTTTDSGTCSFIVKVWLEETFAEPGEKLWRGHVTHVPSGERRYFQSLDDLIRFVYAYIENLDNEGLS